MSRRTASHASKNVATGSIWQAFGSQLRSALRGGTPPSHLEKGTPPAPHFHCAMDGVQLRGGQAQAGSCPWEWCRLAVENRDHRHGRAGQLAIAGRLTAGSSLNGAMVSRVHVTGALDGPFVTLLEQYGAHVSDDGVLVGERDQASRIAAR